MDLQVAKALASIAGTPLALYLAGFAAGIEIEHEAEKSKPSNEE